MIQSSKFDISSTDPAKERRTILPPLFSATASSSQASHAGPISEDPPKYHIVNVLTGTHAALLQETDRLAVVNIVFNLTRGADTGSEVKHYLADIASRVDATIVVH